MNKQRFAASITAIAAVVALSACGGDDSDPSPNGDGSLTEVTIAEVPGVPSAFLAYGIQEGIFEDEGLDIRLEGGGGSPAVASVVGGSVDLAGSNVVSVLVARQEGLPVTMISPGTFATESAEEDFSAVVVSDDGELSAPEDLEGMSIAVDQLQNIGEVTIRSALVDLGVDTDGITYVELPFPNMANSVEQGEVDAAWIIEPFLTQATNDGGVVPILWPYAAAQPGLQIGSILANEDYANENPDLIEAFQQGHSATVDAIRDDESSFREFLVEFTDMSAEIAESIVLPVWDNEIDRGSLEFLNDQMLVFELVEDDIDLDELVHNID